MNNKGADLLFAYGINRFSHEVAHIDQTRVIEILTQGFQQTNLCTNYASSLIWHFSNTFVVVLMFLEKLIGLSLMGNLGKKGLNA